MTTSIVTGGAGFIGSNLIKYLLNNNHKVICIDNLQTGNQKNIDNFLNNESFIFIEGDIIDKNTFNYIYQNCNKIDYIWHLACAASPPKYQLDGLHTIKTSIIGTMNVLDIAIKFNSKFLFTSTSEIYGDPLIEIQDEQYWGNVNCYGPRSCYDESKRCAETIIFEYKKKFPELASNIKIARLFNTYGPNMDLNDGRVITNYIKCVLENKPITIYGDGNQYRCFCYIDDLLNGLIKLMFSNYDKPMNLGNPNQQFTMNELHKVFEKMLNKHIDVIYLELPINDPKIRKPNIELAKNILHWEPEISLTDGIINTYSHFIQNQT